MGQELLPLTLGHVERLESLGVTSGDSPATLAVCVLICCQTLEEFDQFIESRWLKARLWLWGLRLHHWDYPEHFAAWVEYYRHHVEVPAADWSKGYARQSPVPFTRHLRVVLMSELGYSASELSETPYSEALWNYFVLQEYRGRCAIGDQSSIDRRADMRDAENAKDAEELIREVLCRS
jgi:hypothetical protein